MWVFLHLFQKDYNQNFDLSTWQGAVPDILMKGLSAKFGQVDHCKDFLLATEGKTLGEANPRTVSLASE